MLQGNTDRENSPNTPLLPSKTLSKTVSPRSKQPKEVSPPPVSNKSNTKSSPEVEKIE